MKKRWKLVVGVTLSALVALAAASCGGKSELSINVPSETLSATCGIYTPPDFEVVDKEGEIQARYEVKVKSIKGPDGENVEFLPDGASIKADKQGVYTFTYTANDKKVKDATLSVSFALSPPELVIDLSVVPAVYYKNIYYTIPDFSYGAGAVLQKCWIKIYWVNPTDGKKTEITLAGGGFNAAYDTGHYLMVIHTEGEYGNFKEHTYEIPASVGPSAVVPGKIAYFDEQFGLKQAKSTMGNVALAYSDEVKYGDEAGSLHVTVRNDSYDDLHVTMQNLIEFDVTDYDYLVYRIYNPNTEHTRQLYAGYVWFGDTLIQPGQWTEVKVRVSDIASNEPVEGGVNTPADITDLAIRVSAWDAEAGGIYNLTEGLNFYISAVYAVNDEAVEPPVEVPGKIAYFDHQYGLRQITPATDSKPYTAEYDTAIKYGGEAGSLKITFDEELRRYDAGEYAVDDNVMISLQNLMESDVSSYDRLVFYVYNAAGEDMRVGYLWSGEAYEETVLAANAWTRVEISVADIRANEYGVNTPEDITGFTLRLFPVWNGTVPAGSSIYLSAVYAVSK